MASLQELKKRVLAVKGKELGIAIKALNSEAQIAADLNAEQLAQGLQTDGSKSTFSYAPFTIAVKKNRSGLAGVTEHLTNYDTGESYKKLYGTFSRDQVAFGTQTDKEDAISERMEGKAFGLTQDNKEIFIRQHVKPIFLKIIRELIKL